MNVVCIGSGYVGTVTGTAFAAIGHRTTIVDIDPGKIDMLNSGIAPIFEPGLEQLLKKLAGKALIASTSYKAVGQADVVFICVGTPSLKNGAADLRFVKAAAESVGKHLNPQRFTVIINKSTVPVGTSDLVSSVVEESSGLKCDEHFAVVSNPEFLREGFAVQDVFFPERIVIGTYSDKAKEILKALYAGVTERTRYQQLWQGTPLHSMIDTAKPIYLECGPQSAEVIKYASNAFLAIKISYINEVAKLCEALGANVLDVAKGMGTDSRIGNKFLQVSSGWSGSCLPKDTAEILATSRQYGCELSIVKAAVESNQAMLAYCVEKLQKRLQSLHGKKVGVLGLTFKPDTDDARETQASFIVGRLLDLGCYVAVYDPKGMEMFRRINPRLEVAYCKSVEETARRADAIILLTHWDEFRTLDWTGIYHSMRNPYLLDTRNFLDRSTLEALGFCYEGIGIL